MYYLNLAFLLLIYSSSCFSDTFVELKQEQIIKDLSCNQHSDKPYCFLNSKLFKENGFMILNWQLNLDQVMNEKADIEEVIYEVSVRLLATFSREGKEYYKLEEDDLKYLVRNQNKNINTMIGTLSKYKGDIYVGFTKVGFKSPRSITYKIIKNPKGINSPDDLVLSSCHKLKLDVDFSELSDEIINSVCYFGVQEKVRN
ncbi:hypothetical protein [Veronia pacifica]|uniref:Uncharacterized protein n=1 Tax=Veronia pacifica TaxID=1080227 RepID=A0A1C3E6J9_9GAMM|nr:hypothetical protein [Veronia pacifica]ODA28870.1 hypothetical protein A8L45_22910 [Veronia pacifica]